MFSILYILNIYFVFYFYKYLTYGPRGTKRKSKISHYLRILNNHDCKFIFFNDSNPLGIKVLCKTVQHFTITLLFSRYYLKFKVENKSTILKEKQLLYYLSICFTNKKYKKKEIKELCYTQTDIILFL